MGIITKEVEINLNSNNVKHYEALGYDIPMKVSSKSSKNNNKKNYVYDFNKSIIVNVNDMLRGSRSKVLVKCDYCGKEKWIHYRNYLDSIEKYGVYSCNKCLHYKSEKTNLEKYGTEHYSSTLECKEKIKNTCLANYGTDCPSKCEEIKEKTRNTNLQRYGVEWTMQSQKVKEKANETLCKNGTQKTSKQQLYLCSIFCGEINYPISCYATDICIPKEKLAIEYDGGGHDLRVVLGRLTQEEFDQKELIRDKVIKREGYKIMRIISRHDYLPSDIILLQMLSQAKEYFSNTNHTWINYDIDNSRMINAENKDTDGVFFDYGELRRIKETSSEVA